ncbi:MAG: A/G-specific adenine glycosylase, partial [Actinomycetota bacterium]
AQIEEGVIDGVFLYTASAVAAFAFGARTTVLDTNVRRVLARLHGDALPTRSVTTAERARAAALLPEDGTAARWSEGLMELGALVCTPEPRCGDCPVSAHCGWLAAGRPASAQAPRPAQPWTGTDRQSRGQILAALRATDVVWVGRDVLLDQARVSEDAAQPERALTSLVRDGLVTRRGEEYALGGDILHR